MFLLFWCDRQVSLLNQQSHCEPSGNRAFAVHPHNTAASLGTSVLCKTKAGEFCCAPRPRNYLFFLRIASVQCVRLNLNLCLNSSKLNLLKKKSKCKCLFLANLSMFALNSGKILMFGSKQKKEQTSTVLWSPAIAGYRRASGTNQREPKKTK